MLRQRRGSRYAAQPIMVDARLVDALRRARRTLVFSGAGISTASGIPDFRGPNGVWTRRRPVDYDEFLASEPARVEYWDYKLETWDVYQQARPNAAHDAVVALERAGKVEAVVTQNVDGLHRRAGTSPSLLVELHGTDLLVECQTCHTTSEPAPHFACFRETRRAPRCAARTIDGYRFDRRRPPPACRRFISSAASAPCSARRRTSAGRARGSIAQSGCSRRATGP